MKPFTLLNISEGPNKESKKDFNYFGLPIRVHSVSLKANRDAIMAAISGTDPDAVFIDNTYKGQVPEYDNRVVMRLDNKVLKDLEQQKVDPKFWLDFSTELSYNAYRNRLDPKTYRSLNLGFQLYMKSQMQPQKVPVKFRKEVMQRRDLIDLRYQQTIMFDLPEQAKKKPQHFNDASQNLKNF